MKRGVGRFITGSVIMAFLCVCAVPIVFGQPAGWESLTLPKFGTGNPKIWDGVYRWKTKVENCRKWANGKREKALMEENLWMVLEYDEVDGNNNGEDIHVPYCYKALFFSSEPSLTKFNPETLIGWGVLCPDWPPLDIGEPGYLETYLIDGAMCKVVDIGEGGCDLLQIKFQARLAYPYKNPPNSQNARASVKATPMEGWAVGLCGPSFSFFDASFDATPDNAFLKCKIKWKATWQKELPSAGWVTAVFDEFEEPCDLTLFGFKAFPLMTPTSLE